jgi:hypothetical protein
MQYPNITFRARRLAATAIAALTVAMKRNTNKKLTADIGALLSASDFNIKASP